MDPKRMTDEEIHAELERLAREERAALKPFIILLREFDDRKLAGATQYATTFSFCTQGLRLSEGETHRRLQIAGLIYRHASILDMIEDGRLTITTASLLAPYLNHKNYEDLTTRSFKKGRRDVEKLVAEYQATPAARDLIVWMGRRLSAARPKPAESAAPAPPEAVPPARPEPPREAAVSPAPESARVARLHCDVPEAVMAKLERARGLLRHKFPEGKLADLLDEALEALLDRIDRDRKEKPAKPKPVLPGLRRIPEWVKDEVWKRDGGRCAFHSVDGKRCEAAEWLEFDHIMPFALGGASDDPDNVRLLCRAHNQHRAREDFGDAAWSGGSFALGDEGSG